ncbi:hypothetical protein CKO51_29640 [Rhodopirellula sp. SM50]|nr:hypothetical protein [Rhodopirellula sp. SM50]PAY15859.1 hypothetical protein CKO51_29640 [Rhodopirellula sp. SM50]
MVFELQSVKATKRDEGKHRIGLPRLGTLSIELADRFTRHRSLIQNAANQSRLSVFPVETGGAGRSKDTETKADDARPDKRLA